MSVVSGIVSAITGSDASDNAASTQANAQQQSAQLQKDMYEEGRADMAPWRQSGQGALGQLDYLMGIPYTSANNQASGQSQPIGSQSWLNALFGGSSGQGVSGSQNVQDQALINSFAQGSSSGRGYGGLQQNFSMADFYNNQDPGYGFRKQEGMDALQSSAAAKGGFFSGKTGAAIEDYSQGLASQEYQNAYSRDAQQKQTLFNELSGIAGTGQTAASTTAQLGSNYGQSVGNQMTNSAQSIGDYYMAGANAMSSGFNNMGRNTSGLAAYGLNNGWFSGGNALDSSGNPFTSAYGYTAGGTGLDSSIGSGLGQFGIF